MLLAFIRPLVHALALQPLQPAPASRHACRTSGSPLCSSLWSNDGGEVDWDKEAAALAKPSNKYVDALKNVPTRELISEFVETSPKDVQLAVKATVSQLVGSLPPDMAEGAITTSTGRNLASLMFSMQMTGYMFRNAEYRRTLLDSISADAPKALPAVSGKVSVRLGAGMQAEVDAAAYMAELRAEVEGLRAEVAAAQEKQEQGGGALISYLQGLSADEVRELSGSVSKEVLDAMSQLISRILGEMNAGVSDTPLEAPLPKLRELLVWQLVSGYKLRELEAREELTSKFWDQ